MLKNTLVLFTSMLVVGLAEAQVLVFEVLRSQPEQQRLLVKGAAVTKLGPRVQVLRMDSCRLDLVKIKKNQAVLSSKACAERADIAVADQIAVVDTRMLADTPRPSQSRVSYAASEYTAPTNSLYNGKFRFEVGSAYFFSPGINDRTGFFEQNVFTRNFHSRLGLGYSYMPEEGFGFIGGWHRSGLPELGGQVDHVRASLAYSLNPNLYAFGGLSVAQLGSNLANFNLGMGAQVGFGLQLMKYVGLEFNYTYSNNAPVDNFRFEGAVLLNSFSVDLVMSL